MQTQNGIIQNVINHTSYMAFTSDSDPRQSATMLNTAIADSAMALNYVLTKQMQKACYDRFIKEFDSSYDFEIFEYKIN